MLINEIDRILAQVGFQGYPLFHAINETFSGSKSSNWGQESQESFVCKRFILESLDLGGKLLGSIRIRSVQQPRISNARFGR